MVINNLMKNREFSGKMLFWFSLWGSIPILSKWIENGIKKQRKSSTIMRLIGFKCILTGIFLNAIAGKTLKRYGHFDIKKGISAPERVVDNGIYSCMKHPAQFGSGLIGLGIGMLTGKLSGLIAGLGALMASFIFILNVEEPDVMSRFSDYCKKMGNKPAFTLKPACIMRGIYGLLKR